ncbi:hypothetical protein sphantq_01141 [Sphingobium sp. AntQ-1]|nr:hypothetical protein sphantq_01141 [Sphingobium sp. AntQ-1]
MSPWESAVKISNLSQGVQEMVNTTGNEGCTHKI